MPFLRRAALAAMLAAFATPAAAEPTPVVVRVLSEGAKFIGTTMGGVDIVLRDAQTGAILARGVTEGTTGETARIMTETPRNPARADADTAAFRAVLDLAEPTRVRLEAWGPRAQPQAAVMVTSERWLIPGKAHDQGDGWVVELPGLVIDAVAPAPHQRRTAGPVPIVVDIAMLCGCPIEPGSLWDASRFDVRARLTGGGTTRDVALAYAGETGRFSAEAAGLPPGAYLVTVTARDRETGAAGVDRTSFLIR